MRCTHCGAMIPDDQVREDLGEIDLSAALEQELETTVLPKEQGEEEERPAEEPVQETVPASQPAAFGTAVEGLMRHHLTEEEHRRLFTYFAPVPGMSQQINEALDTAQESACARRRSVPRACPAPCGSRPGRR